MTLTDRLRDDERIARHTLLAGCEVDRAMLDSLVDRSLQSVQPTMQSVLQCCRAIEDNANVRLRARFGIYVTALLEAQINVINGVSGYLPEREWARLRPQRRFALPRLELCATALPDPPCSTALLMIDAWLTELLTSLRETLRHEVERAQGVVLRRGATTLARIQVTIALGLRRSL